MKAFGLSDFDEEEKLMAQRCPIHSAIARKDRDIVKLLTFAHAGDPTSIRKPSSIDGSTPIHIAAEN